MLVFCDLNLLLSSRMSIPLRLAATRGLIPLLALSQTRFTLPSFDFQLFLLLLDIMQFSRFILDSLKSSILTSLPFNFLVNYDSAEFYLSVYLV